VRAAGSYVIAWCLEGLPVTDEPIAPWPEWLVIALVGGCSLQVGDDLDEELRLQTQRVHPPGPTLNLSRRTQQILRKVEQAKLHTRNKTLYWAACRFGEIMTEGRLRPKVAFHLLKSAAQICGLTADDGERAVVATILSGLRRGAA